MKYYLNKIEELKIENQVLVKKFIAMYVHKSDATHNTYLTNLLPFIKWCEKNNIQPRKCTRDSFISYFSSLTSSRATVRVTFSSLLAFYESLGSYGLVREIQKIRKKMMTGGRDYTLPFYTEPEKIFKLIHAKITKNETLALRDELISELFYISGLRRNELINLTIEQLGDIEKISKNEKKYKKRMIIVKGKGRSERFIPILIDWLERFQNYLEQREGNAPYVFVTRNGNKMDASDIYRIIKTKAELSGILHKGKPISPHKLRSTFATQMGLDGANPKYIQILLGHKSGDTTMRYQRVFPEQLQKVKTPEI